jgi:nitrogen fixation NifU-like protein
MSNKLYQRVLLDHNKNPRHFGKLDAPTHHAHGVNTLCGDDYHIHLVVTDGMVTDVGFYGEGCAISKSAASLMAMHIKGTSLDAVIRLKDAFIQLLTTDAPPPESELGHLMIFQNVKSFPMRVKCATLIWRALEAALQQSPTPVSTEDATHS